MHHCLLQEGQLGLCGARKRQGDKTISINYGKITSMALDPIEKKPLRMFHPGSLVLSVGSFGCNLSCPFCQNHEISMQRGGCTGALYLSPEELAAKALAYHRHSGNIGLAFTYNEPLIGWEYVRDSARLVKNYGMQNILVTNGSATLETLGQILPYIDAMNIDLKGFQESYYQRLGGDLDTVKSFIVHAAPACHVELTTLIVPGENDSEAEMEAEAKWIASAIGRHIPLHVTRFFPRYQMNDRAATEVAKVNRLADIARRHLAYVWTGNC
jgi:pyruvate formate lyase activating enzyme